MDRNSVLPAIVGGQVALATPEMLASEFNTTEATARLLLLKLSVPLTRIGDHDWFAIHALVRAFVRLLLPDMDPDNPATYSFLGDLYGGARRKALMEELGALAASSTQSKVAAWKKRKRRKAEPNKIDAFVEGL
jgi:hypothetical protein